MPKEFTLPRSVERSLLPQIPLNVLVVFDDYATGCHAHETLLIAEAALGDQKFNLRFWGFEQIQNPSLGGVAAREAAAADLVFFATADDGDLPPAIKEWIELWEDHLEDGRFGLAVMLNGRRSAEGEPSPGFLFLNQVARRHGADFCHTHFPVPVNHRTGLDASEGG